jgi:GNAT superfamily N-acetyltransferase
MQIRILDTKNNIDIRRCLRVFAYLRPHLDETEFIKRVQAQAAEGYTIAYIESGENVVAAAGYRVLNFLAWGKVLYLDDLITDPEKKKAGYGSALLEWVAQKGKELGCDELHLDTGYQRHDAHRLYLKNGLDLSCHHLSKKLR